MMIPGTIVSLLVGIIIGGLGMIILLSWAFHVEVDMKDDELPRTDKKNLD